jgi:hypothetical protein
MIALRLGSAFSCHHHPATSPALRASPTFVYNNKCNGYNKTKEKREKKRYKYTDTHPCMSANVLLYRAAPAMV